jgi:hypothetical protein
MKVPDGYGKIHGEEKAKGKVLRLNKFIYGLMEAVRK